MSTRQKQPDAAAATTVQIIEVDGETVENKISHPVMRDVGDQDNTHLRDVTTTKENDLIYVADTSNQDEAEDAKEDCRGPTDARSWHTIPLRTRRGWNARWR